MRKWAGMRSCGKPESGRQGGAAGADPIPGAAPLGRRQRADFGKGQGRRVDTNNGADPLQQNKREPPPPHGRLDNIIKVVKWRGLPSLPNAQSRMPWLFSALVCATVKGNRVLSSPAIQQSDPVVPPALLP